jgi:cytochrome c-type biogenesis protein CcsB
MGAITFELGLVLYFAAMVFGFVELFRSSKPALTLMLVSLALGFGFHTASILYRYFVAGHLPITNPHEATSFFAWCVVFLFFLLEYRYKIGLLGSFIIPIAVALMVSSALLPKGVKPLSPILRSNWLGVHTVFAFMANASFALAAGVGVMYLVQEHYVKAKRHLAGLFQRLPSLQRLDEINYRLITVGFPLFTLAMITGMLWADSAWGSYWRWDAREVWSLITWLIFAIVLHARLIAGWRGRRAAVLAIIGFVTIIVAFGGVKLLQKGQHVFL